MMPMAQTSTDSESYSVSMYSSGAIYGPLPQSPWAFLDPVVNGARKTSETPKSVILSIFPDLSKSRFSREAISCALKNYEIYKYPASSLGGRLPLSAGTGLQG